MKEKLKKLNLAQDFLDMLESLSLMNCRFIIVGGHAMAAHGYVRATGDIDIFVDATSDNAKKIFLALKKFGAPLQGISQEDFEKPGMTYQIGLPPLRIDFLTEIDGLSFDEAFVSAVATELNGHTIHLISLENLIKNKKATSREKDLADVKELEALRMKEK